MDEVIRQSSAPRHISNHETPLVHLARVPNNERSRGTCKLQRYKKRVAAATRDGHTQTINNHAAPATLQRQ